MQLGIRSKLVLAAAVLIAVSGAVGNAIIDSELRAIADEHLDRELAQRTELAALDLARSPLASDASTDALADALGEAAHARVTVVGLDGAIIGDSALSIDEIAALGSADDGGRPEIRRALEGRRAEAERVSPVAPGRVHYLAAPIIRDGAVVGAVRLGVAADASASDRARLRRKLAGAAVIALVAAVALALVAARLVSQGVGTLAIAARRLASGDLEARARPDGEDELAQLGRSIDDLAEGLRSTLRELVDERDLLSGILENLGEGVLLLDRDGRIALVNPALREMLLLARDDVGKHLLEVVRHAQLADLLEAAKRGRAQAEIEVEGLKPRRVLVRAEALDRELGGTFVVFYDVTDLRRLETLRRDFVANASHELRTPVTCIRSATETLQVVGGGDPATLEKFLGIVARNAERLQRLLEDLLDLSRIESRELELHREEVGLRTAAERAVSLLSDRAARARTTVVVDIGDDAPPAWVDARALEQVFENLLDNAIKYCPGATVRVSAKAEGTSVRLDIADRGAGIEARHLDRLFERFYRVDAGRSRQLGGTGLGLAIVKHLVEAMDGTIEVESRIGLGTTFRMRFPTPHDELSPTPMPASASDESAHSEGRP